MDRKPVSQMTRDERIAFAFRNVDTQDVEWLQGRLEFSGHDQFWKNVMRELDGALRVSSCPKVTQETKL